MVPDGYPELILNLGHPFECLHEDRWHASNERLLLLEGRLSLRVGEEATQVLDAGGFTYLPARDVQRISCVSATRCTFYLLLGWKPGIPPRASYQVMPIAWQFTS